MFVVSFDLQRFAAGTVVNATTQYVNAYTGEGQPFNGTNTLSPTMKTFYDTSLLENSRDEHYYAQFGMRVPLPRGKGRVIEWRKWNTLPNAEKLIEGVIPDGKGLGMTYLTSPIEQYGMFVTVSDLLELHAADDVLLGASEELGASMGNTQDTLIRNELLTGTNVMYAADAEGNVPIGRWGITADNKLTSQAVAKAATFLKKLKAPTINGDYVALVHPSQAEDLRLSKGWMDAHQYAQPEEIYNGEIGKLHGVRFIETNSVKVWADTDFTEDGAKSLAVTAYTATDAAGVPAAGMATPYKVTVTGVTADMADRLVDKTLHVAKSGALAYSVEVAGIAAGVIWLKTAPVEALANGDALYPGEGGDVIAAGQSGVAVYGTLIFGKEAFGIIDPDGGGAEMLIKDKSQIGGPLDQFSTIGYKLETGCKILYQERMVRLETGSSYSLIDEAN